MVTASKRWAKLSPLFSLLTLILRKAIFSGPLQPAKAPNSKRQKVISFDKITDYKSLTEACTEWTKGQVSNDDYAIICTHHLWEPLMSNHVSIAKGLSDKDKYPSGTCGIMWLKDVLTNRKYIENYPFCQRLDKIMKGKK
jgi:hypothetical protein